MSRTRQTFGLLDGRVVEEIQLDNGRGLRGSFLTWGAVLRRLNWRLPDGRDQALVLGLDTFEDYRLHSPHFGAIAGRFANRIRDGRFTLDGVEHQLTRNQDGKHSLHGGGNGFGKQLWELLAADGRSITLAIHSPDGEAGYPGGMTTTCRYELTAGDALRVELCAFADKPTIVNLCHHSYFRLDDAPDILDHQLMVRANIMTPVDAERIPDGSLAPVSGTPFDFRTPRPIRMLDGGGSHHVYDNNFVLRRDQRERDYSGIEMAHAATLSSRKSGVSMQVWTSEPCLQVYDGYKISLPVSGLDGERYQPHAGICLEPQHAPDSPNLPHLPSTVLRPGELYRQVTEYRFSIPQPD
jgi:aldose 1-epimerase